MEDRTNPLLEAGGTETTVGPYGARRYRKPLHKFRWCDIKELFGDSLAGWQKHNAPRLGAALAFYTLLSLIPLLLVLISIAGLVFGSHAAQTGVLQQIEILVGSQRARIIAALLEGAQNKADGLLATSLGMLTLLFGASAMLTELRDALDTIWEVPPRHVPMLQEVASMVRDRLWSFGLVLGMGFILTTFLILSTWISALGSLYTAALPAHEALLHLAASVFSFVVVTGLFAAVYKLVPIAPIQWRDVILGAVVTSLFFTLGNLILGLYLGRSSFSSTYGAAASTVLLSLWVYYSSQVFFLGAEFTKSFADRYGTLSTQEPLTVVTRSNKPVPPSAEPPNLIISSR